MIQKLPKWIGSLITLEECDGDSEKYIEKLFEIFKKDFIDSRPTFKNKPVLFDKKLDGDKPNTFVHITTEDDVTTKQRILSMRRCERIGWIRAIIENANDPAVLVWQKKQATSERFTTRTYLFLEQENFLVVLQEIKFGYFVITAIYVDNPNQKRKHLKAYEAYKNQQNLK
jgi:hypothetical protein